MICLYLEKIWWLHKTQMNHLLKEILSLELNNLFRFQIRKRKINLSLELCSSQKPDSSGVLMTSSVIKVYIMKLMCFKIWTKHKRIWRKTIVVNLLKSKETSWIQKFWQDQLVLVQLALWTVSLIKAEILIHRNFWIQDLG